MKKIAGLLLLTVLSIGTYVTGMAQIPSYDAKYDLTVCTTQRNANGELYIKNGPGNTFTGKMLIDNDERDVFGWYVEKISEGGGFVYNTKGIVFYVKIVEEFQYLQLFKALYNYDQTFISGTFFFWGNEFIFYGNKSQGTVNPIDTITEPTNPLISIIIDGNLSNFISISPNPTGNTITISSSVLELQKLYIELYSINGILIHKYEFHSNNEQINVSDIPKGNYIIKVYSNEGIELGTVKIAKY